MAVTVETKKSGFIKIIALIVIAAVITGSAFTGIVMSEVKHIKLSQSVTVDIAEGDGVSVVSKKLHDAGIINYPAVFKLQAAMGGYNDKILPGEITVTNGMSYEDILKLLASENRSANKLTFPEGFTVKQIKARLLEAGLIDEAKFDQALKDDYDYKFLKNLPDRDNRLEGYLFPSTYYFDKNMSEHEIIDKMLNEFDANFKDEYYTRAKEIGMTTDEIVTMASVIEGETDSDKERAKVSGVFYNRLKAKMPLQSCATVQYILGERKPVLSVADTKIESPYNTYLNKGLPIGPVCNPETACIEAALYPEETDAYYFVMGKNGEHIFSKTFEEHEEAVKRAQN